MMSRKQLRPSGGFHRPCRGIGAFDPRRAGAGGGPDLSGRLSHRACPSSRHGREHYVRRFRRPGQRCRDPHYRAAGRGLRADGKDPRPGHAQEAGRQLGEARADSAELRQRLSPHRPANSREDALQKVAPGGGGERSHRARYRPSAGTGEQGLSGYRRARRSRHAVGPRQSPGSGGTRPLAIRGRRPGRLPSRGRAARPCAHVARHVGRQRLCQRHRQRAASMRGC